MTGRITTPVITATRGELAAARGALGGPVVLVPTMGALHAGHRVLLRRARELAGPGGAVAVSIFVNPLQFAPGEDLDRYPRTFDDDLAVCAAEGTALVFAPRAGEMYPGEQLVTVDPGPVGRTFEGEFRPGFFDGVLTVVLKLFGMVRPDVAVFGEKDAQQLALVRRMVADFALGITVESVPTVRDDDGLATSSRNRYLSAAERAVALALPGALSAGREAARAEPGTPASVLGAARRTLDASGLRVTITAANVGASAAPFGAGAHPYFTVGTNLVDPCRLCVPAATRLIYDDRKLPVGSSDVGGTEWDFRTPREIGATRLDVAYTDLARDPDGLARVRLEAPDGRRLTIWCDSAYPWVQLFTGDPFPPPFPRRSLAIEPMTCPPEAFNSGEDLVVLQPGQSFTGQWGIDITAFRA